MINEDLGLETESLGLEGSDNGITGVLEADMALSPSLTCFFVLVYGVGRMNRRWGICGLKGSEVYVVY